MQRTANRKRLQGLDFLRSLAILLVFLSHYEFITGFNPFGIMNQFGGIGVDLFFVLSGYLIGDQLLGPLSRKEKFFIKDFYLRRFFRIIPAYYFMLLVYFTASVPIEQPLAVPLWKFLTFIMNMNATTAGGFSNAWSLCVEQHFYLFFPLVASFILNKYKPRYFAVFLVFILVSSIGLRYFSFTNFVRSTANLNANYLRYVYFPTYCRLDGILFGISAAFCKNYYSFIWNKLIPDRFSTAYLLLGLLGLFAARCLFQAASLETLSATFGYTVAAISSLILLLAALNPNSPLNKWRIPGVAFVATCSYSIYLTQKICIFFVFQFFANHFNSYHEGYLCVLVVTGCTLIAGWLLYRLIEVPFLQLRTKLTLSREETSPLEKRGLRGI